MTDWDAALTSMAGPRGGDLRVAMAEVASARERPYYEAEVEQAAAEADHGIVNWTDSGACLQSGGRVPPWTRSAVVFKQHVSARCHMRAGMPVGNHHPR